MADILALGLDDLEIDKLPTAINRDPVGAQRHAPLHLALHLARNVVGSLKSFIAFREDGLS